MSITERKSEAPRMHRREFMRIGFETAAAFAALSAASTLVAGCGGGEESAAPPAAAPSATPSAPAAAPAPAPAAAPAPAPAPAPAAGAGGEMPLVTEVAAMAPTVQALQYVHQSAKPDQRCTNCMFFTAAGGGRGKCQLFVQGYVEEGGWCMSWAAKPPASPS